MCSCNSNYTHIASLAVLNEIKIYCSAAPLLRCSAAPLLRCSAAPLLRCSAHISIGCVKIRNTHNAADFVIRNLNETNQFIVRSNKFKETKLLGAKGLDYSVFCENIKLINNKKHLIKEGLAQIIQNTLNVNSKRTIFTTEF